MYADDNSVLESAKTIYELEIKTDRTLARLFQQMRLSCLAVYSGKTQIMMMRSTQRMQRVRERGEDRPMKLNI